MVYLFTCVAIEYRQVPERQVERQTQGSATSADLPPVSRHVEQQVVGLADQA